MGKPNPSSDAELLAAIAGGHGDSFEVFYRRHLPTVIAFLMGRVGDREAAADLSAEVFASVLTSAQRYRPDSDTAVPWLISIAHNKLVSSVRRRVVESRHDVGSDMSPLNSTTMISPELTIWPLSGETASTTSWSHSPKTSGSRFLRTSWRTRATQRSRPG
jgi:RNA polymerase sigma factor (sigma-70 family)